ncbi:alkaline phosphatase family protein [Natronomonas amylolytica]|uniref:alkaline phosphatase family protein n=1 Tax=Natronomonas amylolytica TaxID=3108498 RepID=UPI00300B3671
MLVVLGLDSWDYKRYQQYSTPTVSGLEEKHELRPFDGLAAGELVTQVLWPAMLYGKSPKNIWPEFYEGKSGYNSSDSDQGVTTNATYISYIKEILPASALPAASTIAKRLGIIENSNEFDKHSAGKVLIENQSSLVTAAESPSLVSIPGINEDMRNYDLNEMVKKENADNPSEYSLGVSAELYEKRAFELDSGHLAQTLQKINDGHDLVWAHFAGLDFIQHMFGESEEIISRWYRFYDNIVRQVQSELDSNDTLVVLSDHGMNRSGLHSHRAFFGSTKNLWDDEKPKMERLREILEAELEDHGPKTPSESVSMEIGDQTKDHLKELGYF